MSRSSILLRLAGLALALGLAGCGGGAGNDGGGDRDGDGDGDGDGGPPSTDAVSNGGTITFQDIGATGWYPSRRDPAVGPCDVQDTATCCLARHEVTSDALTPWDQDLIMTLRGPMRVARLVVYQPSNDPGTWDRVASWSGAAAAGVAFAGNGTETAGFVGDVGTECLVNVSTDRVFACGAGSAPFCPPGGAPQHHGWAGSKLFVLEASMPHAADVPGACSDDAGGNWYDAPWIGLSLGELVRSGQFGGCHCYAKDPAQWWLADGCGQFNVFEVVNDNNMYKNLGVFSTNMFGYAGYVGEGPCGPACDVAALGDEVDLIDKQRNAEAAMGAIATPTQGPRAAFRRPDRGPRYFVILLDVDTRTVQLAMIHPRNIPKGARSTLPDLPATLSRDAIDALLALRLPR